MILVQESDRSDTGIGRATGVTQVQQSDRSDTVTGRATGVILVLEERQE